MRRLAISATLVLLILSSCTEKKFVSDNIALLEFSLDTVYFDTVFTTVGSATKELRVVNPNKSWVKIDRISTSDPDNSSFRLNIDGAPGNSREDLEIAPGDSMYIFIDADIDPNLQDNPIAVLDSILFSYHNREQNLNLLAWGQDINLISGSEISTETWSGSKPYVIYNSVLVDTGEVLTIEEGVKVLFHRGATMFVKGTLMVNGSLESPVLFSSDRYETLYNDIPGQWGGLYFINGSQANEINYAVIRNAVSAIHAGNVKTDDPVPDLRISNSMILHNTVSGISSLGASIEALNCIISHCGYYSLFLVMGGSYNFLHCTIENYWDYSIRTDPGVILSDYFEFEEVLYTNPLEASFSNSVISGSLLNEVGKYPEEEVNLNCSFRNCLLKIEEDASMWSTFDFSTNILNLDPLYIGKSSYDFRPDTLSPLIDSADPAMSLALDRDIRTYPRFTDNGPDIGAYERQIGEKSE